MYKSPSLTPPLLPGLHPPLPGLLPPHIPLPYLPPLTSPPPSLDHHHFLLHCRFFHVLPRQPCCPPPSSEPATSPPPTPLPSHSTPAATAATHSNSSSAPASVRLPCPRYLRRSTLGDMHHLLPLPQLLLPAPSPLSPYTSSSSKLIRCRNPKCTMLHPTSSLSSCTTSTSRCPPYSILSNSGSTNGYLLTETLNLLSKRFSNFAIGCSTSSSFHTAGMAGFGRGPLSLHSPLGLTKFGYCLLSRGFDDKTRVHTSLVLDDGAASRLSYTPLMKNPAAGNRSLAFDYYAG